MLHRQKEKAIGIRINRFQPQHSSQTPKIRIHSNFQIHASRRNKNHLTSSRPARVIFSFLKVSVWNSTSAPRTAGAATMLATIAPPARPLRLDANTTASRKLLSSFGANATLLSPENEAILALAALATISLERCTAAAAAAAAGAQWERVTAAMVG